MVLNYDKIMSNLSEDSVRQALNLAGIDPKLAESIICNAAKIVKDEREANKENKEGKKKDKSLAFLIQDKSKKTPDNLAGWVIQLTGYDDPLTGTHMDHEYDLYTRLGNILSTLRTNEKFVNKYGVPSINTPLCDLVETIPNKILKQYGIKIKSKDATAVYNFI